MKTEEYSTLNVGQLRELIADVDDDKEIRVWCEEVNDDGVSYLSGRRLIGITDEEDMCTFCAARYVTEVDE